MREAERRGRGRETFGSHRDANPHLLIRYSALRPKGALLAHTRTLSYFLHDSRQCSPLVTFASFLFPNLEYLRLVKPKEGPDPSNRLCKGDCAFVPKLNPRKITFRNLTDGGLPIPRHLHRQPSRLNEVVYHLIPHELFFNPDVNSVPLALDLRDSFEEAKRIKIVCTDRVRRPISTMTAVSIVTVVRSAMSCSAVQGAHSQTV